MLLASMSSPVAIRSSTRSSGTRSMVIAASSRLTAARVALLELGGEEQVACTRRRSRASCRTRTACTSRPAHVADLLLQLAARGGLGRLAVDVALARRDLEQRRGRWRRGTGAPAARRPSVDRPAPPRPRRGGARRDGRTPRRRARRRAGASTERNPASHERAREPTTAEAGRRRRRPSAAAVRRVDGSSIGSGRRGQPALGPLAGRLARTPRTAGADGRAGS